MTTFNTGNPIGSTDARDLSDNAENFDRAINSTDQTWIDRKSFTRDTFEGALSKLSFYRVGTFAAGYTLTNMRQTLEYNGHEYSWAGTFPKVVAAGATPATSGGIGAGAWVDRTDETLRSELTSVVDSSGYTSALDLFQSEQYRTGRIDLAYWGVIADGLTDNSTALLRVRDIIKTKPNVRWVITHSGCNLVSSSATISYTSNYWLSGVKEFILTNVRLKCTYAGPLSYLQAPLASRDCFSSAPLFGNAKELGELINSAAIGDLSVTLVTAANSSKFRVGSKCMVYGLNSQIGGWPPNFKRFDYLTIKSVNTTTGVIVFCSPLENAYDSSWPDWSTSATDASAPRISPYTKYASDGWSSDVQANEYAEFVGCSFERNPNAPGSPFNFTAITRKVIDCFLDNNNYYYAAQNAKYCETTRLQHTGNSLSNVVYEFDKNTKECVVNSPSCVGLVAATGVDRLIINGGSVNYSIISPRVFVSEGTEFKITRGTNFHAYNSGNAIRSAIFRGCSIDSHLASTTSIPVDIESRKTIASGAWSSEGDGKIRILYSAYAPSAFVDLMCYVDSGVLCLFSSHGKADAGLVSEFSIDASTKDLILTLTGTEQYATYNTTSEIRLINGSPTFDGCSFPNAAPFQASGRIPFGPSGAYNTRGKTTCVYSERDMPSTASINLVSGRKITEVRLKVTRAYTGVDSPNITFLNLYGGDSAASLYLHMSTSAAGVFIYNYTTTPTFFDKLIQTLRFYKFNNPSGDWSSPTLGPRFTLEVDYVSVV